MRSTVSSASASGRGGKDAAKRRGGDTAAHPRGTSGVVRAATVKATGDSVAVKIIRRQNMNAYEKRALDNELKLQRLRHNNIVTLIQAVDTEAAVYIVTERLHGGELFDRIIELGRYTEENARTTFRQIAEAVKYLHAQGVVHRDIKPENLLLADQSEDAPVKLCGGLLQGRPRHRTHHTHPHTHTHSPSAPCVLCRLRDCQGAGRQGQDGSVQAASPHPHHDQDRLPGLHCSRGDAWAAVRQDVRPLEPRLRALRHGPRATRRAALASLARTPSSPPRPSTSLPLPQLIGKMPPDPADVEATLSDSGDWASVSSNAKGARLAPAEERTGRRCRAEPLLLGRPHHALTPLCCGLGGGGGRRPGRNVALDRAGGPGGH